MIVYMTIFRLSKKQSEFYFFCLRDTTMQPIDTSLSHLLAMPEEIIAGVCTWTAPLDWLVFLRTCHTAQLFFAHIAYDPQKLSHVISKALKHGKVDRLFACFSTTSLQTQVDLRLLQWNTSVKASISMIWPKYKFSLQSLSLHSLGIPVESLNTVLALAPQLKSMQIISCSCLMNDEGPSIKWPQSLEHLTVYHSRIEPLFFIQHVFTSCPQLKSLTVSTIARRIVGMEENMWRPPASLEKFRLRGISIARDIAEDIMQRFGSLKSLCINEMNFLFPRLPVRPAVPTIPTTLTVLDVSRTDMSHTLLQECFKHCVQLRELHIGRCPRITESQFLTFTWPKTLRVLCVNSTKISCRGVSHIARSLPQLAMLNIDSCSAIQKMTPWRITVNIGMCMPKGLKVLNARFSKMTNRFLSKVIEQCSQLEELDVSGSPRITNEWLRHCRFPQSFKHLIVPDHIKVDHPTQFKISGGQQS